MPNVFLCSAVNTARAKTMKVIVVIIIMKHTLAPPAGSDSRPLHQHKGGPARHDVSKGFILDHTIIEFCSTYTPLPRHTGSTRRSTLGSPVQQGWLPNRGVLHSPLRSQQQAPLAPEGARRTNGTVWRQASPGANPGTPFGTAMALDPLQGSC